jgi:hypothetical protein
MRAITIGNQKHNTTKATSIDHIILTVAVLAQARSGEFANVSDGSEVDITPTNRDIRFSPESGHCLRVYEYTPSRKVDCAIRLAKTVTRPALGVRQLSTNLRHQIQDGDTHGRVSFGGNPPPGPRNLRARVTNGDNRPQCGRYHPRRGNCRSAPRSVRGRSCRDSPGDAANRWARRSIRFRAVFWRCRRS